MDADRTDPTMKVAFIGTHGVGKTTLAYGLAMRLKQLGADVGFLEEVARRCPFPINEETSVEAQTWILMETIRREIELQKIYGEGGDLRVAPRRRYLRHRLLAAP